MVAQNLAGAADADNGALSLVFAIPDHPWMKAASVGDGEGEAGARDGAKAAAVRIVMTVAERGEREGLSTASPAGAMFTEGTVVELSEQVDKIFADLQVGPDVSSVTALLSSEDLSCRGVSLHGEGFIVSPEEAVNLGLGRIAGLERHIRPYLNGRDLTGASRKVMVIDLFGLSAEHVRLRFPEVYQWLSDRVKPEREGKVNQTSDSQQYADKWWLFGKVRSELRAALQGLSRYIATVETAKHRVFVFLDASVLPDNRLVNFAFEDAFALGVLSSSVHVTWTLATGGTLEGRPIYTKTRCFDPFPFPVCAEAQQQTIRDLAEQLDAHRKSQQALHPTLTLTAMYNTLDKLRAGAEFTDDDTAFYQGRSDRRHPRAARRTRPCRLCRLRLVRRPAHSPYRRAARPHRRPERRAAR